MKPSRIQGEVEDSDIIVAGIAFILSRARHICMLCDNWPVIDWREPIGLQERLKGRSSHNGEISVMSRDSSKGNLLLNC